MKKKKLLITLSAICVIAMAFTFNQNKMEKKIIKTANAPAPIGPYNQAVLANNMLFVSGQIAIDPKTNQLIIADIETETRQVMENIQAILEEAGMNLNNVVKSSIFITDMNNFSKINAVYGKYFEIDAPARETVQVVRLPKDVNVEISVIAIK